MFRGFWLVGSFESLTLKPRLASNSRFYSNLAWHTDKCIGFAYRVQVGSSVQDG